MALSAPMRATDSLLELSASDLSHFLACRHRTALDLAVAQGLRDAPTWVDPALALLQERGLAHERRYVESLEAGGLEVLHLESLTADEAVAATRDALHDGADVIVQGALREGRWFGRPDVLRRVESATDLGAWSYEAIDTKLAKETRGATVLQLALYSDLLRTVQGTPPAAFYVVTPSTTQPVESFRVLDYAAYARLIRAKLEATLLLAPDAIAAANYPEPVEHCEVCRWWSNCDKRRRDDDHLSLVAGISRLQTRELEAANIDTLAALGSLTLPLPIAPSRGAIDTYVRVHHQARVQLQSRSSGTRVHEILPWSSEHGLLRLPAPSAGDVFLDLEGDPFAGEGGREYLFGLAVLAADGSLTYYARWAHTDHEERCAFQEVVDQIVALWNASPGMHVYHYASYEAGAFKRLMGRHATREAEVDGMLRGGVLVDLHAVVKHTLRASVERYSIKDLEPFFGFSRAVDLAVARANLRVVERALELSAPDSITDDIREAVAGYNRDDCLAAYHLRHWLETLRADVEASGIPVPRPAPRDAAPTEELDARTQQVRALAAALIADIPADAAERTEQQQAQWLLANLLDWHRREAKATWWEFYRLCELTDDELVTERAALAHLQFVKRIAATKAPTDRYAFPSQDTDISRGDPLFLHLGVSLGKVAAIDYVARTICGNGSRGPDRLPMNVMSTTARANIGRMRS